MARLLIVAFFALTAPLAATSSPGPQDPSAQTGLILGDVTYEGQDLTFTQPVTIASGSTLRIIDSTVRLDAGTGDCRGACGSFFSADILLSPGATLMVQGSVITTSDPTTKWDIAGVGATVIIEESHLEHGLALHFEGPGVQASRFAGNTFDGATLEWFRGGALDIVDNHFHHPYTAVSIRDVEATVTGNVFTGEGSVGYILFSLEVMRSTVGSRAHLPSGYTIQDNEFIDHPGGIAYRSEEAVILSGNEFHDVPYPYVLPLRDGENYNPGQRPIIEGNTFTGRISTLVWAYSGIENDPALGVVTFRHNNVLTPVCHVASTLGLEAEVFQDVDARHNWWGAIDGPQIRPDSHCSVAGGKMNVAIDPWAEAPFQA